MNKITFTYLLSIAIILVLSTADLTAQKKKQKGNSNESGLSYEQQVKHDRLYIDANKSKILGDFDEAIAIYKQCLQMNPSNSGAAFLKLGVYYMRESHSQKQNPLRKLPTKKIQIISGLLYSMRKHF